MNKIQKELKAQREKYVVLIAEEIRERNFDEKLRKEHNEFINSQLELSENFYKRLVKEKNGVQKVMRATGLDEKQSKKNFFKLKHFQANIYKKVFYIYFMDFNNKKEESGIVGKVNSKSLLGKSDCIKIWKEIWRTF